MTTTNAAQTKASNGPTVGRQMKRLFRSWPRTARIGLREFAKRLANSDGDARFAARRWCAAKGIEVQS